MPAAAVIAGRSLTAVVTALGIAALLLGIGWVFYGAHVVARTAPALVVTVIVGTLAFCCLGFALASVIHDENSAQPIIQAVTLPLYFISGVFVPASSLPHWLLDVASVFPVRHLAAALLTADNPHTSGAGFAGVDLLIVAAWGAVGLFYQRRTEMATATETTRGGCPTHGIVEARRELPKVTFPPVYTAVKRALAKRRPFVCPECGSRSRPTDSAGHQDSVVAANASTAAVWPSRSTRAWPWRPKA